MNISTDLLLQIALLLVGALIGTLSDMFPGARKNIARLLAIALISIAAIWWYSDRNPQVTCPYNGATDLQTFTNLIFVEEEGALTKDISKINKVYLVGATVTDVASGVTLPVAEHYQQLFSELIFEKLHHYDIRVVKITDSTAWVKSSDDATYVWTNTGERVEVVGKPGASHYKFSRDSSGCWKISHFSKNAFDEPFP
jgi:hypothetical protein